MLACVRGHTDVVRLLLNYSGPIDFNARDYNGRTAFGIASRFGEAEVIDLLKEYSKWKNIDLSEL